MTYSVTPALPAGLTLDTATGRISGVPAAAAGAADYVVTAYNLYGSTTVTLNLGVGPAPSDLSYMTNPAIHAVDQPAAPNAPALSGQATSWSVEPPLPSGLTLNASTGVIAGTPTVPTHAAAYTITAANSSGSSTSAVLSLATLYKPSALTYAANPATYRVGFPIPPNTPTVAGTGPFRYSVTPLPPGLSLDSTSGVITGAPVQTAPQAYYLVTASNPVGSTTAMLSIFVPPSMPTALAPARAGFEVRTPGAERLAFGIPPAAARSVRLEVLLPDGARVTERAASLGDGLTWDGTARAGRPVGAGPYLLRLIWLDAARKPLGSQTRVLPWLAPR